MSAKELITANKPMNNCDCMFEIVRTKRVLRIEQKEIIFEQCAVQTHKKLYLNKTLCKLLSKLYSNNE